MLKQSSEVKIAKKKVIFLSFEEARIVARSLNFYRSRDWYAYCKSGKKPINIPVCPSSTYKNKGWVSMVDWLGTSAIVTPGRIYCSFEESRCFSRQLNLKSKRAWMNFCKTGKKPEKIPCYPYRTYQNSGWISWSDWLNISRDRQRYLSFIEARDFVHKLNLKNKREWKLYCKNQKRPQDIPATPEVIYALKGWLSWSDWLGTFDGRKKYEVHCSYEVAEFFVHSLHLKDISAWTTYCKSGKKPIDIPSCPPRVYKNRGWSTWGNWLGTGAIATSKRSYREFEEARIFVHSLKLERNADWLIYCRSGEKPTDIPANPGWVYGQKGWKTMTDWLGNGCFRSNSRRNFLTFEEAREFIRSLNLKNRTEWRTYCKSKKKPKDIPATPNYVYRKRGWSSWSNWLGVGKSRNYRSFKEARSFARKLGFHTHDEWWEIYCRSGKKPYDIPAAPDYLYKGKGWISWADWLGRNRKSKKRAIKL